MVVQKREVSPTAGRIQKGKAGRIQKGKAGRIRKTRKGILLVYLMDRDGVRLVVVKASTVGLVDGLVVMKASTPLMVSLERMKTARIAC